MTSEQRFEAYKRNLAAIRYYYRHRAAGGRKTLKTIAAERGISYAALRQAKCSYDYSTDRSPRARRQQPELDVADRIAAWPYRTIAEYVFEKHGPDVMLTIELVKEYTTALNEWVRNPGDAN